eukprot:3656953-Pyramimonas_sp.AAC.2
MSSGVIRVTYQSWWSARCRHLVVLSLAASVWSRLPRVTRSECASLRNEDHHHTEADVLLVRFVKLRALVQALFKTELNIWRPMSPSLITSWVQVEITFRLVYKRKFYP